MIKINKKKSIIAKTANLIGILLAVVSIESTVWAETYEYDELNRVIKVTYDDGSYVSYTYDRNGNITDVYVYEVETEKETTKEEIEETTEKLREEVGTDTEEVETNTGQVIEEFETIIEKAAKEDEISTKKEEKESEESSDIKSELDTEDNTNEENEESLENITNKVENKEDKNSESQNNKEDINTSGNIKGNRLSVGAKVLIGAAIVSAFTLSGVFLYKSKGKKGLIADKENNEKDS